MNRLLSATLITALVGSAAVLGSSPNWVSAGNNAQTATNSAPDSRRAVSQDQNGKRRDDNHTDENARQQPVPPAPVQTRPPIAPPPVVNSDNRNGRSTNAERGDRRGFNDPRPPTNWQTDHNSGRSGNDRQDQDQGSNGNNWNLGHDTRWIRNHNWHDQNGRDWNRDRRWYDQYRYSHFRFYNDQYFARSRFSIGSYYAPNGYGSRIWIAGDFLPFVYFQDRYFLDSFDRFELYNPLYGCQWVRVGSDALLVDRDSGYILDVIHDLFW